MEPPRLICRFARHFSQNWRYYKILLLLFALAILFAVQLGKWGARQPEYNHLTISHHNLQAAGPLKIVFFSDLHNDIRKLEEICEQVTTIQPDLILFGGDLVMADERFKRTGNFIKALRRLSETAPVYAILGNHDYEKADQVARVYQSAGVTLLRNQEELITLKNNKQLKLVGLGDRNEGDDVPELCLERTRTIDVPILLLAHDPECRGKVADYDWDLMLCGHIHGGQIGIPFLQQYISLRTKLVSGLYPFAENKQIFVTRGVGAIMGMRFFCPPEVNIITIPAS